MITDPGSNAIQLDTNDIMNINLEEAKTTPNNISTTMTSSGVISTNAIEMTKNDFNSKVNLNMAPALSILQDKVIVEVKAKRFSRPSQHRQVRSS